MAYPAPLELIASSQYDASMVRPKALAAAADNSTYFEAGVEAGTGPYMLADYTPGSEVVLKSFPDYWGGWGDNDHYENIVVSIVSDAVTQEQLLTGNEVDLALSLPATSSDTFVNDSGYNVQTVQTLFNYVGFLNTTRPPLDDTLVRQAISYAIPYDDIITVGAEGRATQARGAVPAGVWPYSEDVPQYHQDLDKARDLLIQAGHEGGGLKLKLTYAAENTIEASFAPLIADALGQIGINVRSNRCCSISNGNWRKQTRRRRRTFSCCSTGQPTAMPVLTTCGRCSTVANPFFNLSYWKNDEFDTTLDEAINLSGTDRAQSQALYDQAQTLMVDEAPGLFFMDVGSWYTVPTWVAGFE